jgi:hypothetical protein
METTMDESGRSASLTDRSKAKIQRQQLAVQRNENAASLDDKLSMSSHIHYGRAQTHYTQNLFYMNSLIHVRRMIYATGITLEARLYGQTDDTRWTGHLKVFVAGGFRLC